MHNVLCPQQIPRLRALKKICLHCLGRDEESTGTREITFYSRPLFRSGLKRKVSHQFNPTTFTKCLLYFTLLVTLVGIMLTKTLQVIKVLKSI